MAVVVAVKGRQQQSPQLTQQLGSQTRRVRPIRTVRAILVCVSLTGRLGPGLLGLLWFVRAPFAVAGRTRRMRSLSRSCGMPHGMGQALLLNRTQHTVAVAVEHGKNRAQPSRQLRDVDRTTMILRQDSQDRPQRLVRLAVIEPAVAVLVESMQQTVPELPDDIRRRTVSVPVAAALGKGQRSTHAREQNHSSRQHPQ